VKRIYITVFALLTFSMFVTSERANATEEAACSIKLKEILIPSMLGDNYSDGPSKFPNYRRDGLPDNFTINDKTPIVITKDDLKEIKVNTTDDLIIFKISDQKMASKIKEFTSRHEHGLVALEICNDVVSSVRIMEEFGEEFSVTVTKREADALKQHLERAAGKDKLIYVQE